MIEWNKSPARDVRYAREQVRCAKEVLRTFTVVYKKAKDGKDPRLLLEANSLRETVEHHLEKLEDEYAEVSFEGRRLMLAAMEQIRDVLGRMTKLTDGHLSSEVIDPQEHPEGFFGGKFSKSNKF